MPESNLSVRCKADTFKSHYQTIWTLCLNIARRWTNHSKAITADDLAQMAMIKVWKNFQLYDHSRPLKTFVYAIAINAIKDYCKGPDNYLYESFDVNFQTTPTSNMNGKPRPVKMEIVEDVENLAEVYVAHLMSSLPDRQFKIIEQSFGVGTCDFERSDISIAADLAVTRQTVVSDRKQAMKTMRIRAGKRTIHCCAA